MTSSNVWNVGVKAYATYFDEPRAAPPPDEVASESLNPHEPYSEAGSTTTITIFDPSTLQHTLGPATLDMAFVQRVLAETGPVLTPANGYLWQYAEQPAGFPITAEHEADYYDWFNWVLCQPAASAVNAVRDELYRVASAEVPAYGYSRTDKVNKTHGGGAADIIHKWSKGYKCTPHEFKRDKALRVHDESVLDFLVEQAGVGSGYNFRSNEPLSTLQGKAKSVVSQVINEMMTTQTGHAIICTEELYAMLRLKDTLQLEISPVYAVRGSSTQGMDAAMLVLFYTHAALRAGKTYADAFPTRITAMRVTLPPSEVVFRGGMIGRTTLISKSHGLFPWVRFDGDVRSSSNDVTIAYGRLIWLFFTSCSLVAKAAHGPSATQRLVREHDVYGVMRALQGVAIPKMTGMFTTEDGRNTVLMMSYAGKALREFSELEPRDKLLLFHRLVRLHQTGVQHNDFEPRNVTKSSSGPLIIDFDRASLDHNCAGASCKELLQAAQALDLDPAEIECEPLTMYNTMAAFVSPIVSALFVSAFLYYLWNV
ncbi:hypothetical protein B0H14DRAFT_2759224 [Mycena olivaceomarginata]|nr:hypothetical protein B0H14DRAFT_2759224 [Mycena olivaceomarginata]